MTTALNRSLPATPFRPQIAVVAVALALIAGGTGYLGLAVSGRQAALLIIGSALGIALYHAMFGFTGAWRRFLTDGRGQGVRAQLIMLAMASTAFALLLTFTGGLGAAIAPIGVSVIAGAFLFGIGMQLGGGCASGTLFTVGGGSTRMGLTLIGFVAGSVIGTLHMPWWLAQPAFSGVSMYRELGWASGLGLQLAVMAALYAVTVFLEHRRHGSLEQGQRLTGGLDRIWRGGWPLLWGAGALAALNVATLLVAGRPWGITWGFALWGAKIVDAAGIDMSAAAYWRWPYPARALAAPLAEDITSVMNIGIVCGALLAAGLAGKFSPILRIPLPSIAAAIFGGLLLGYGARLAFGCNIGALFSGIASGSPHGWLWLVFALVGTYAGIRLRPMFRLTAAPTTATA
jgi:uncharacterized protein